MIAAIEEKKKTRMFGVLPTANSKIVQNKKWHIVKEDSMDCLSESQNPNRQFFKSLQENKRVMMLVV